jgi:hypothetical protein
VAVTAQKRESSAVILPHHKKQLAEALVGTDLTLPELLRETDAEAQEWANDSYRCGQAGNLLVSKLVNRVLIAREHAEKARKTAELLAISTVREQEKARQDREAMEAAKRAEEELIEDDLGEPLATPAVQETDDEDDLKRNIAELERVVREQSPDTTPDFNYDAPDMVFVGGSR